MEALRALVDQFVADLQVVIRQEALKAVRGVLGDGAAPARRGPGRPRKTATRGSGRSRKATKRGPGRPRKAASKRGRRSEKDAAALKDQVLTHVRANPGQRLEEIGRDLGMDTQALKQPVAKLLAAGALRRKGKARGTRYYVGGGGKRKAAKKAGKRATKTTAGRKATKRKATRKAGKKAKAKRATRKAPAKKARRKLTPEQKAVLVERLAKARAARKAAG